MTCGDCAYKDRTTWCNPWDNGTYVWPRWEPWPKANGGAEGPWWQMYKPAPAILITETTTGIGLTSPIVETVSLRRERMGWGGYTAQVYVEPSDERWRDAVALLAMAGRLLDYLADIVAGLLPSERPLGRCPRCGLVQTIALLDELRRIADRMERY